MNDNLRHKFDHYIAGLFAEEDDTLRWIKQQIEHANMPQISVDAGDGYLLQWLMKLVGVKKAVEIGTLGGYSGTWIARALPDDGKLYTLEINEKHAEIARNAFDKAAVSHKVDIVLGDGRQSMKDIEAHGPFDMVFIDADKGSYPDYLAWAVDNLRPGGMVAAHNAFRHGRTVEPAGEEDHAMRNFNQALADEPRLHGMIIPLGDGMAVGIKQ